MILLKRYIYADCDGGDHDADDNDFLMMIMMMIIIVTMMAVALMICFVVCFSWRS